MVKTMLTRGAELLAVPACSRPTGGTPGLSPTGGLKPVADGQLLCSKNSAAVGGTIRRFLE